jgi:hypothetical protein
VAVNQPYRYDFQAIDPDGDPLPVLEFLDGTPDPASQISWWRADGTTTDDRGDNDGALRNGATFAPGKFGLTSTESTTMLSCRTMQIFGQRISLWRPGSGRLLRLASIR